MKKIIALLASFTMMLSFSSCSDKPGASDSSEIKVKYDTEIFDNSVISFIYDSAWNSDKEFESSTERKWETDFGAVFFEMSAGKNVSIEQLKTEITVLEEGDCHIVNVGDYECISAPREKRESLYFEFQGIRMWFDFPNELRDKIEDSINSIKTNVLSSDNWNFDSEFEGVGIKMPISSEWSEELTYYDDYDGAYWCWLSETGFNNIGLFITHNDLFYSEDSRLYEGIIEDYSEYEFILENQVKYYIREEEENYCIIEFINNGMKGSFTFNPECEEIVMQMIENIEFI